MKLFGLKTCDTCRKARKALPGAVFVDVRDEGVPMEVLERAAAAFGARLINTRSTTWRDLDAAARETPPLELVQANPTVMKRPLIETNDGTLHLGWDRETQTALT